MILSGIARSAWPIEYRSEDGEFAGHLDTTITLGASLRVQNRDPGLVGVVNGGSADSINGDNGNLNFDKGDFTSLSSQVTHELDLRWRNLGFFGRLFYFYDAAIMDIDPERTDFSSDAKDNAGRDIEVLDAYATGDFNLGSLPLTVRAGNQVISWGESTFIPNGINTVNPVDVTKLRVAGAELRDALIPVLAVDANLGLSHGLSAEAFWQAQVGEHRDRARWHIFLHQRLREPGRQARLPGLWPTADHRRSAIAARCQSADRHLDPARVRP